MDYRKTTSEAYKAWVAYCKACPNDTHSVVSFVAGYNAATLAVKQAEHEKRVEAGKLGYARRLVEAPQA